MKRKNRKEVGKLKAKFELFEGEDDKWYFNLKAMNGKIIAQSEGYNRKRNAIKGINAVKVCAGKAEIKEL